MGKRSVLPLKTHVTVLGACQIDRKRPESGIFVLVEYPVFSLRLKYLSGISA